MPCICGRCTRTTCRYCGRVYDSGFWHCYSCGSPAQRPLNIPEEPHRLPRTLPRPTGLGQLSIDDILEMADLRPVPNSIVVLDSRSNLSIGNGLGSGKTAFATAQMVLAAKKGLPVHVMSANPEQAERLAERARDMARKCGACPELIQATRPGGTETRPDLFLRRLKP